MRAFRLRQLPFRSATTAILLATLSSCSDDPRPPKSKASASGGSSVGGTASGQGGNGRGGARNAAGAAGNDSAGAGASDTGRGGGIGEAGASDVGGGAGRDGSAGGAGGAGRVEPRPCASDSATDPPAGLNAQCDPAANWGASVRVPLLEYATRLVAVTPDELTLVFYAETSGPQMLWVSDRSSADASFSAGQELPSLDVLALSPDGLRLMTLSSDGSMFSELTRTARGEAFGAATEGAFAALNADAEANDVVFSGAVVSADDETLYYLAIGSGAADALLRVSQRQTGNSWPVGTPLEACEFQAQGDLLRRPTGVSADGLTLFYFDEVRRSSRAAWRESPSSPFVWFRDLGAVGQAQPNATCARLYYSDTSGPSFSTAE